MRVGYCEDIMQHSTIEVEILAETTDGRFVCRRHTSEMITRWDGSRYLTHNFNPLFLKNKSEVVTKEVGK